MSAHLSAVDLGLARDDNELARPMVGKNCGCGRWVPSFASKCIDCGRVSGRTLAVRLAAFYGASNEADDIQRPSAQRATDAPHLRGIKNRIASGAEAMYDGYGRAGKRTESSHA